MGLRVLEDREATVTAARGSILEFTRLTKPDYVAHWHHLLLAKYLDELVSGRIRRLMVFMPPRHGKSELVSRRLPSFALGLDPDELVMACSYGADLAQDLNRDVQRIIDTVEYAAVFPETRLFGKNVRTSSFGRWKRTSDEFEVVDHQGKYHCAGVGGPINGMGFGLGVVDDPIKDADEAHSPTMREKTWRWWNQDFQPRMQENGRMLLTMTRRHRDDLAGRELRENPDKWTVLELPALRKHELTHPEDPREGGGALWPAFLDAPTMVASAKTDPAGFAALYQQDPRAPGGSEWPSSYFGDWIWADDSDFDEGFDLSSMAADPSKGKDAKRGDYWANVFLGVRKNGLIYVDADLDRKPVDQRVRDLVRMCDRYRPDVVGIETNTFQELLLPVFQTEAAKRQSAVMWQVHHLMGLDNRQNKEFRIRKLGHYLANRLFRFRRCPGCQLLVDQLQDFPCADHDDGPDALEMAVRLIVETGGKGRGPVDSFGGMTRLPGLG